MAAEDLEWKCCYETMIVCWRADWGTAEGSERWRSICWAGQYKIQYDIAEDFQAWPYFWKCVTPPDLDLANMANYCTYKDQGSS